MFSLQLRCLENYLEYSTSQASIAKLLQKVEGYPGSRKSGMTQRINSNANHSEFAPVGQQMSSHIQIETQTHSEPEVQEINQQCHLDLLNNEIETEKSICVASSNGKDHQAMKNHQREAPIDDPLEVTHSIEITKYLRKTKSSSI